MKQNYRTYLMYLEDIQLAMSRIAEYIGELDFKSFKKDYKIMVRYIFINIS